jgi:type IV secretory pathway TraG/TraD family ATPase VirD4
VKYIWALILWVIILGVKHKQISEFVDKLKTKSCPQWKAWLELAYKNPFLTFTVFSAIILIIFDHTTTPDQILVVGGFGYLVQFSIVMLIKRFFFPGSNSDSGEKQHVRGAAVTDEDRLSRAIKSMVNTDSLPISQKVKIPQLYETMHFFTIGRPGCGKSQLFYRVIQKVLSRGDKAIIYDFKGDQVAKFYDPEKHVLFNPFDNRCAKWNIFNEIESPLDIRSIANSLIPITGNDPYWSNAARDVFVGILSACYQSGKKTNDHVYHCCNMPVQELAEFLSHYKGTETATRHLAQDKAGASIMSVMSTSTQCFEYLRNINGDFSIRKWASDDTDARCVFLTNYTEISDTIRPILSLFVELAGKRVLSMPDDLRRRIFFFIDEFGTLNNLPTIPAMLTNGRSKGMSIWVAIQDIGQIEKIYGKDISQSIINSCATSFTFAVNDPYTADFISKKLGEREIRQVNVSYSESRKFSGGNSSSTTTYQTMNERVVMASEVQNLPNMVFFLKIPEFNITPLSLNLVSLPDLQPAFSQRDDFNLSLLIGEPQMSQPALSYPEQPKKPLRQEKREEDEFHL